VVDHFKNLDPLDPTDIEAISSMRDVLVPIYGIEGVDPLIRKIKEGKDRKCEIYLQNGVLRGLIVYKNFLSNEYQEYGVKNGFEEKTTLPLPHPDKSKARFSDKRLVMLRLLHHAADNAVLMKAESFFGTVSGEKIGSLRLLLDLGFEIAHIFKEKFKKNVDEYLIVHKNPKSLYELTLERSR